VNYQPERDALLEAIETAGPGTLIHPFYGRIENAVALPVTFDETVKRLGRLEIPITFEISDSEGIPEITEVSTSGITNRKDTLNSTLEDDFATTYSVNNAFQGNYEASQSKANNLVTDINNFVTTTSISSSSSAEFFAKLDVFSRSINQLVGNPRGLGSSVIELINDISKLYDTSEQTLLVSQRFFTFGEDDTPINPTTAGLIERQRNNLAFNEAVQVAAIGVAYEASTGIDFVTVDDVEEVQRDLEAEYEDLRF